MNRLFPELNPEKFAESRDALHGYSRILGSWTSVCRERRKHWWHASLRPSLTGISTGVIYSDRLDFELSLNFRDSLLIVNTAVGEEFRDRLIGQPISDLFAKIEKFLLASGLAEDVATAVTHAFAGDGQTRFPGYSPEEANTMGRVLAAVSASFAAFRNTIREETSPIQLWPHHFDLAMLWLPGEKVPDQDPHDEESADKQMNFGFTFGDPGIPEPYFYVTAYPSPEAFAALELPAGTEWHNEGFTGAVLKYRRLLQEADPSAYLLALWNTMLTAGRASLVAQAN